jgi:iron(III) transport system permease protein
VTPASVSVAAGGPPNRRRLDRDDLLMRAGICLLFGWLLLTLILPLWWLLSKSFQNQNGEFIGLANYLRYFSTPTLFASVWNSLFIAVLTTAIVLPLAFVAIVYPYVGLSMVHPWTLPLHCKFPE